MSANIVKAKVLEPLTHHGRFYAKGMEIVLDPAVAFQLVTAGQVEIEPPGMPPEAPAKAAELAPVLKSGPFTRRGD
jgi:hypothetical protein